MTVPNVPNTPNVSPTVGSYQPPASSSAEGDTNERDFRALLAAGEVVERRAPTFAKKMWPRLVALSAAVGMVARYTAPYGPLPAGTVPAAAADLAAEHAARVSGDSAIARALGDVGTEIAKVVRYQQLDSVQGAQIVARQAVLVRLVCRALGATEDLCRGLGELATEPGGPPALARVSSRQPP